MKLDLGSPECSVMAMNPRTKPETAEKKPHFFNVQPATLS